MNLRQTIAILVGFGAIALIFMYPPYYFVGQFFDGVEYFYYKNPPALDNDASYCDSLVANEVAYVILCVASACCALSAAASRRMRLRVFGLQFAQLCIFLACAPSFGTIFAIEMTWALLFLIALPTFFYAIAASVIEWAEASNDRDSQ